MNLSSKKVLIWDANGLGIEHAIRMAKDVGKVWYFTPWQTGFPLFESYAHGYGLKDIEKVLQCGKSQCGCRGIYDPVHGFVEFGVPVDEQDDHGEFRQLFRHRDGKGGEQDIGYERDNNVFKEKCDDCGNHAQKIHFRNKGEGFGFVAVLLVEEPEPEQAGRQGNDKDEPAVHSGEWAMIPY